MQDLTPRKKVYSYYVYNINYNVMSAQMNIYNIETLNLKFRQYFLVLAKYDNEIVRTHFIYSIYRLITTIKFLIFLIASIIFDQKVLSQSTRR